VKKVRTTAAKPSKKVSQQKLTIGLDLGDRSSWYCVLNESDEVVLEQRYRDSSPSIRHNPTDSFPPSLLIKLKKFDGSSILDNKSDGYARRGRVGRNQYLFSGDFS